MRIHWCTAQAAALGICCAGVAAAQRPDSARTMRADSASTALTCAPPGTTLRLWTGGTDSARARLGVPDNRARGAIDTVITLDITDRTWTRDNFSAGVAIGAAGTSGRRNAPWNACAGAGITFGRVTAVLHNVHGQIRFKADPSALRSLGDTTGSPPPARPPRR
ncbi:MAG: hypothetical protein ACJ8AD_17030 [Gemmatimonadaceae bacterium]